MYKKIFFIVSIIFFVTNNLFADLYDPERLEPVFFAGRLNFGNSVGLIGETAEILPGNNPTSNPHVPGALVQFILDGGDGVISPPDENGDPTGDDDLQFTVAIGHLIPAIAGEIGLFTIQCSYGSDEHGIYARVFNKSTVAESTYYGNSNLITIGSLRPTGDEWEIDFDVDEHGLLQTNIPIDPSDDWVATANAGISYSGTEGDSLQLDATATTDPDTDLSNLTFAWDLDDDGEYDDATGITTNYAWLDNDTFSIGLKVSNPVSGTASVASSIVTITNANPQLTEISDQLANRDEIFTFSTTYFDPGLNDTHTVQVNWGDGNIENNISVSGGVIELSHTYESIDSFTVELTLTDDDGGSDSTSFTVNVTAKPVNVFVDITIDTDVHLMWPSEPSYNYQIWFLDGNVQPFNASNGTWQLIDIVTGDQYNDIGDEDGFDNIADTPDDRDHPLNVTSRHYCVFEIAN